jgi:hypothetical protein
MAHRLLEQSQIGTGGVCRRLRRWRKSCTRIVGRSIARIAMRLDVARFQCSNPNKAPVGEVIAEAPSGRSEGAW